VLRCLACLLRQAPAPEQPAIADAEPQESEGAPSASEEQQQSTTVVELYDDNMDADLQVEISEVGLICFRAPLGFESMEALFAVRCITELLKP